MTEGYVCLPPDSDGKKLRTRTSIETAGLVHDEIVELSNASGTIINPAKEDGNLQTLADSVVLNKLLVGNARNKFKDNFVTASPDLTVWDITNDNVKHLANSGGNAVSSAYLRISLDPTLGNSGVVLSSIDVFEMPFRLAFGISISQRIVGQEVSLEMVGVDDDDVVELNSTVDDKAITGTTISITSNVGTVTLTGHGLKGGDRICLYGCPSSLMNVGPVAVTVLTADSFTVPITASNGSYNCTGGKVMWVDPVAYAENAASYLFENATVTNASFITRRDGSSAKGAVSAVTVATTTATQANTSPYTDAFLAAGQHEFIATLDALTYRSFAPDGVATMSGLGKRTQGTPDEEKNYKIRVRAKNLSSLSVPVGRITQISKSGTTTATVTTDVPHGLTTSDMVQIYGVRDITNFPNLTASTAVSSIITDTSFTIIIAGAVSASSAGGAVWRNNGAVLAPGVLAQNIQSISRTNNVVSVVGNTTWATPLPGEYFHLYGMDGSGAAYDGAYKVLRVNTSTLELESTGADFGSISCGGAVLRRTDVRVHFVRLMDYTRLVTEVVGGRGSTTDINDSVPVAITGSATITANPSTGTSGIAKAEDAAAAAGDIGVPAMTLRQDVQLVGNNVSATNDYMPLIADIWGRLWIADTNIQMRSHWNGIVRGKIT